jgi:hypothetical protein
MDLQTITTVALKTVPAGTTGAGAVLGYVAHSSPVLIATVPAGILAVGLSSAVAKALGRIIETKSVLVQQRMERTELGKLGSEANVKPDAHARP